MANEPTISLPAMCFAHLDKHEDGHYFLIALKDGRYDSLDGCHSEPGGVAQALYLTSHLACLARLHAGRDYYMVHVTRVPGTDGVGLNHDAIEQNNKAFEALR